MEALHGSSVCSRGGLAVAVVAGVHSRVALGLWGRRRLPGVDSFKAGHHVVASPLRLQLHAEEPLQQGMPPGPQHHITQASVRCLP